MARSTACDLATMAKKSPVAGKRSSPLIRLRVGFRRLWHSPVAASAAKFAPTLKSSGCGIYLRLQYRHRAVSIFTYALRNHATARHA
jgi:hypothetical protein